MGMAMMNHADEHVTMQYVADHLFVSIRQVRRWIASGRLDVIRLGHRTVRISRASFSAFTAARRSGRLLPIADSAGGARFASPR